MHLTQIRPAWITRDTRAMLNCHAAVRVTLHAQAFFQRDGCFGEFAEAVAGATVNRNQGCRGHTTLIRPYRRGQTLRAGERLRGHTRLYHHPQQRLCAASADQYASFVAKLLLNSFGL